MSKSQAFRLKIQEPSESLIQDSILQYLKLDSRVAWAERFNTGAHVIDQPGKPRRFIRYAFKGCSDILGQVQDGRFLAIEVKTRTGKATKEQAAFINMVRQNSGISVLARSVDDVQQALNNAFQ